MLPLPLMGESLSSHKASSTHNQSRRADAPVAEGPERRPGIAKPLEQEAPFHDFLDYVIQQETDPNFPTQSEVRYAQTRQSPSSSFFLPGTL